MGEEDHEKLFREIWEAEAFLAEREAERLLFEDIFQASSLPPLPTPPPTPPTPPPTISPSLPTPLPTPPPTKSPSLPTPLPTPPTPPPTKSPSLPTLRPSRSPVTQSPRPTTLACLDGRTREEFLLDQLSEITAASILQDPTTSQGQAFLFMNNDPLNPNVCSYPTIDQRYGLATFYYATDGENWLNKQGWLSNQLECNWSGVDCMDGTLASNLTLRKTTVYIHIHAPGSVQEIHSRFDVSHAKCHLCRRE